DPPPSLRPPVKGARLANEASAPPHATIASWWNIGVFSGADRDGVVLGFLTNTLALGLVLAARTGPDEIGLVAESAYSPPVTLRPGAAIGSNRFALHDAARDRRAFRVAAHGTRPRAPTRRSRATPPRWARRRTRARARSSTAGAA